MPSPRYAPRKSPPAPGLLDGWLLLSLRDAESYGRALVGRLSDRGISIESHHAYRRLRALDLEGAVTSRWTASDVGPRRRSYRLTPAGCRRLAKLAESIAASWQLHETFLRAYHRDDEHAHTHNRHNGPDHARGPSQQPDNEDAVLCEGAEQARPSQEGVAPAVGNQLLAAWLLLLLEAGASYGYGLRRALADQQVHADPGALYRVLRQLEHDGWLRSRWMHPAAGPGRRLYRLTARGRRHLEELVTDITAVQSSHATFLRAYASQSSSSAQRK